LPKAEINVRLMTAAGFYSIKINEVIAMAKAGNSLKLHDAIYRNE
jgi:hypothetical protein